jgi:DNA repair protein RecN (Recombination protein N)
MGEGKSESRLFLKELNLNNFATFKHQSIEFSPFFNAIIGETGSGKSLILDALEIILGSRADKKLIRKDSPHAIIEAIFHCDDKEIEGYFDHIGYPVDGKEIHIKRIIYSNGKSKSFINHQMANLSAISEFGRRFTDLVGQFENQKLLSENYQLTLLDTFSGNNESLNHYRDSFNSLIEIENKIKELKTKEIEREQRLDYLKFQISQIEELNISKEDEEELKKRKIELSQVEKRNEILSECLQLLEGDNYNSSVLNSIDRVHHLVLKLPEKIQVEVSTIIEEIRLSLQDIAFDFNSLINEEFDQEAYSNVIDQLDKYQKIKRKFGQDISLVLEKLSGFKNEYEELLNNEFELSELIKNQESFSIKANKLAETLHNSRVAGAKKLSIELTNAIRLLNMDGATFKVQVSKGDLNKNGFSNLKLLAETNPGEGYFEVKKIASGGELSRILLSIRQILSSNDSISIFLFDEIDTGIGGETALKIGKSLKKVSFNSQVIAITHLPQIAIHSDKLVIVNKEIKATSESNRTFSVVREVSGTQMQSEIELMTPLN